MFRRDAVAICDRMDCEFFGGESKGEVLRKTLPIASKLFIEASGGHSVNRSQVAIDHHLLLTDGQNSNIWGLVSHTADGNGLSFSTNQASRRYQLSSGLGRGLIL
jgi:hypothetical protein